MPTTPTYGFRYPSLSDDPHVPEDIQFLATDVEAKFVTVDAAVAAEVAKTYRATTLLAADTSSVTFSSIPSTLKRLQITWTARSTNASVFCDIRMRINGDAASNYSSNFHNQVNTTTTGFVSAPAAFAPVGIIPAATAVANNFGSGEIAIPGWNAPHPNVNWQYRSHYYESAANSAYAQGGGLYFAAGPYTSITLLPELGSFKAASEFTIYGLA